METCCTHTGLMCVCVCVCVSLNKVNIVTYSVQQNDDVWWKCTYTGGPFVHKHSMCVCLCTDTHPQTSYSNFYLRKPETPNFACGFWFSVLCLVLCKGRVKRLRWGITQRLKINKQTNKIPLTKKQKLRKKSPTVEFC